MPEHLTIKFSNIHLVISDYGWYAGQRNGVDQWTKDYNNAKRYTHRNNAERWANVLGSARAFTMLEGDQIGIGAQFGKVRLRSTDPDAQWVRIAQFTHPCQVCGGRGCNDDFCTNADHVGPDGQVLIPEAVHAAARKIEKFCATYKLDDLQLGRVNFS